MLELDSRTSRCSRSVPLVSLSFGSPFFFFDPVFARPFLPSSNRLPSSSSSKPHLWPTFRPTCFQSENSYQEHTETQVHQISVLGGEKKRKANCLICCCSSREAEVDSHSWKRHCRSFRHQQRHRQAKHLRGDTRLAHSPTALSRLLLHIFTRWR